MGLVWGISPRTRNLREHFDLQLDVLPIQAFVSLITVCWC